MSKDVTKTDIECAIIGAVIKLAIIAGLLYLVAFPAFRA